MGDQGLSGHSLASQCISSQGDSSVDVNNPRNYIHGLFTQPSPRSTRGWSYLGMGDLFRIYLLYPHLLCGSSTLQKRGKGCLWRGQTDYFSIGKGEQGVRVRNEYRARLKLVPSRGRNVSSYTVTETTKEHISLDCDSDTSY